MCGILENGPGKELVKLLSGLFLTITVICPMLKFDIPDITEYFQSYSQEAAYSSGIGEKLAEEAMAEIIKEESEAYILDKAADFHADLSVEVSVKEMYPVAVILEGSISPYAKSQLEAILENDLGITKENQLWT